MVPFMFASCEQTKGVAANIQNSLKASATGHVGVEPNGEGGYEAKAVGGTGLLGYDVYGEAKVGFRKSVTPESEPLPVAPVTK